MNTNELHKLPAGTRDALHVPFVVVSYDCNNPIIPGDLVRFTDETCTKLERVKRANPLHMYQAHGMVNPFTDIVPYEQNIVVFLLPGRTSPVRHTFDIKVKERNRIAIELENGLELEKEQDPNCAECWQVVNDTITRM